MTSSQSNRVRLDCVAVKVVRCIDEVVQDELVIDPDSKTIVELGFESISLGEAWFEIASPLDADEVGSDVRNDVVCAPVEVDLRIDLGVALVGSCCVVLA